MDLKHVKGRVIIKTDINQKNNFTFDDGTTIKLERDYNNLDRAYTQQVLGMIVDGEDVPCGALILFHFNALHAVNEIFNHSVLSGKEVASGIKLFSVPIAECFLWKMPNEEAWNPMKKFEIALRVFRPYTGVLTGIDPKKIENILYVKTGEHKGKVIQTLKACDYQVIFRNEKGIDESIIRFRPDGDPETQREPEAIAIHDQYTKEVNDGNLLVGITIMDAKPLN